MYGDVAGWRAYASARGDEAPSAAAPEEASAALTRASDYVRFRYVANMLPSYGADYQPDGYDLPLAIVAAYIAASYELKKPGFFSRSYTASDQKVLTEVKGIKWTVTGAAGSSFASSPTSTLIDDMFRPFVVDLDRPGFMLRAVGG